MDNFEILISLRKQILILWAVSVASVAVFGISMWYAALFSASDGTRWVIATAIGTSLMFWRLNRFTPDNRRSEEIHLLPTLGLGTVITSIRGVFFLGLLGLLSVSQLSGQALWLPGILYTIGCIFDFFDGYAARKSNHSTVLGGKFDLELDGLGALTAPLVGIWIGQLPVWYILTGLARYAYIGLLWIQTRLGFPVYDLPPSGQRRVYASFNMGFVSTALFPVFPLAGIQIAAGTFMIIFLGGFIRDWLVASGILKPSSPRYQFIGRAFKIILSDILPIGLRIISAACIAYLLITAFPAGINLAFISYLLAGAAISAGYMGRIGALVCLFTSGWLLLYSPINYMLGLLLVSSVWLWLFGTGRFSLWTPEIPILYSRS